MNVLAIGLNHQTSPIQIREQFYLKAPERELLLAEFKSDPRIKEAFILSTCNRTEIYVHILDGNPRELASHVLGHLFRLKKLQPSPEFMKHFYFFYREAAVEHLLRVAASLDSLIIGEKQILGQVKEAVELARAKGMLSKHLNILTNVAIRAGKKAQHETVISAGGSSVGWAAVTMAQNVLGTLEGKSVLIIGTGKMGCMAAGQLKMKGIQTIYTMNRTQEKAEALAREFGGTAVPFWELKGILAKVDVCICSAGASHYLIHADLVETVMQTRPGRPLLLVDISMPRNVDPQAAALKDVRLVSIDELDQVVENSLQKRTSAVSQVEEIISRKKQEFYAKIEKIRNMESTGSWTALSTVHE